MEMISHAHGADDTRGVSRTRATRENNAPSVEDQAAMHQIGRPVQTVGPDVKTTLYRMNGQDRLRVDRGDRRAIPDLTQQRIVIDEEN